MLASLALIILVGLSAAAICQRLRLPRIIGMLLTGILLGPYVLDLLDPSILGISAELRQIALIILLKAGLSLNLADLKRVGRPAVLMSCLPAGFEILGYVLLAPALLGVTRLEAAVMGAVLSAVSPAVVVPRMLKLMDEGYGTVKSIPQMILAGASCDDIFVIVLFTTFAGMAQGGAVRAADLLDILVSILLGVALGALFGLGLSLLFERAYAAGRLIRNSMKVMILLGAAFLLMAVEDWAEPRVAVSGLLAVVSMACVLRLRSTAAVTRRSLVPCPWPWACPAAAWCSPWRCWASSSPRPWVPSHGPDLPPPAHKRIGEGDPGAKFAPVFFNLVLDKHDY